MCSLVMLQSCKHLHLEIWEIFRREAMFNYIQHNRKTSFCNLGDFEICSKECGKIGLFSKNFLQN